MGLGLLARFSEAACLETNHAFIACLVRYETGLSPSAAACTIPAIRSSSIRNAVSFRVGVIVYNRVIQISSDVNWKRRGLTGLRSHHKLCAVTMLRAFHAFLVTVTAVSLSACTAATWEAIGAAAAGAAAGAGGMNYAGATSS